MHPAPFFCTIYTAQPIVPARTVITDLKGWPDFTARQTVNECTVNKCPICIYCRNENIVIYQFIDYLPEITADQWLTTGYRNLFYATVSYFSNDLYTLLKTGLAKFTDVCRHKAVFTTIVTFAGN